MIVIVDSIRIAQFFNCRYLHLMLLLLLLLLLFNFLVCHPLSITHKIHVWYIYLLIYHKTQPFMLGKSTVPPMDPMRHGLVYQALVLPGGSNHSTKVEGRPGAAFKITYNSKDQSVSLANMPKQPAAA